MGKLEIKRLLEKQLELLSEQSRGCCDERSIAELTCQMIRLAEVLLGLELNRDSADEAGKKAAALAEKINEAKTLAGELASLVEMLDVKVQM